MRAHKHTYTCVLMGYSVSLSTWTLGTDRQVQVLPLTIWVILAEEGGVTIVYLHPPGL